MIYEIAKEIATELATKGCPYRVVYGPERGAQTVASPRFVVERNRDATDDILSPRSRPVNPRMVALRVLACRCRVFAKSNLAGAGVHDHERVADQMVDRFTVALNKAVRVRCTTYRVTRAKLLGADELGLYGLETWPGVVYTIEFEIDRGVYDTNWAEEVAEEFSLVEGSLTFTGQVYLDPDAREPIPVPDPPADPPEDP
jgi:hypothetical protein